MVTNAVTLDLSNLAADLGRAARNAPDEVDKLLVQVAEQIKDGILLLVPRKTGRLAASVKVQAQKGRVVVGPFGVDYAVYVEFGTGTRGEFPTAGTRRKSGVVARKVDGKWQSTKETGMRARPYVRPAAQGYLDSLGDQAADVGVQMIVGKQR